MINWGLAKVLGSLAEAAREINWGVSRFWAPSLRELPAKRGEGELTLVLCFSLL